MALAILLWVPATAGAQDSEARRGPYDRWVLQWSARSVTGFGASMGDQEQEFLNELALRTDFLFGRPGNQHVRIGPALELRTGNFSTFEYAAGAMALFPTHRGWPITLSALAGYAHRFDYQPGIGSGPVFVATAAFGYRSFNWASRYGLGVMFFVSSRVHLDEPDRYEITGGIELDFSLAYVIPVMIVRMMATSEDPDEPEQADGEGDEGSHDDE